MAEASSETGATRWRGFGSRGGWLIAALMSLGYLFMFSEMLAPHGGMRRPFAGAFACILGGLSPLTGYVTLQLVSGQSRWMPRLVLAVLAGIAAFAGLQVLGIALIGYARPPGQ